MERYCDACHVVHVACLCGAPIIWVRRRQRYMECLGAGGAHACAAAPRGMRSIASILLTAPDLATTHAEWEGTGGSGGIRDAAAPSDDLPARDRPPAETAAPVPAASVPAGVARGKGAGAGDTTEKRRAAPAPAQPHVTEWWSRWIGATAKANELGVKFAPLGDDASPRKVQLYVERLEALVAQAGGATEAAL